MARRIPTLALQRQYRDLQYIARAMLVECSPEYEDRIDFDDLVAGLVEKIMTEMYEKFSDREISNAITIVKHAIEEEFYD